MNDEGNFIDGHIREEVFAQFIEDIGKMTKEDYLKLLDDDHVFDDIEDMSRSELISRAKNQKGDLIMKSYGVRRPAEITLNGYEWILDEDNETPRSWETEEEALRFLHDNGLDDDDIESMELEILPLD